MDARRVERILRNLVGNAIEHGEGQPVEVTLAADRTAAAITVRDHGVGLKPGEEQHVFNRFWRADPSRVRTVGGTGLGLSISLEDARLHGGWLQVWGQPGRGRPVPAHPAADRRRRPDQLAAAAAPGRRPPHGSRREPRRPRRCAALLALAAGADRLLDRARPARRRCRSPRRRRGRTPTSASSRCAPEPGATPEEIVRGSSTRRPAAGRGHPVARQYLAPAAQDSWADDAGVTVISPEYATVTRDAGVGAVTARRWARSTSAASSPSAATRFIREFTVEQVDGEWRIADPAGRPGRLEPDFERLYDQLKAYFLDPTGQRVVPDPRYLVGGEAQPTALVGRLLGGPRRRSRPAWRTRWPARSCAAPVTVADQTARVDLTGLPAIRRRRCGRSARSWCGR